MVLGSAIACGNSARFPVEVISLAISDWFSDQLRRKSDLETNEFE